MTLDCTPPRSPDVSRTENFGPDLEKFFTPNTSGTADLFTRLNPPCGDCSHLGAAIESGVRYCHGHLVWRRADERLSCAARATMDGQTGPGMTTKPSGMTTKPSGMNQ